MLTITRLKELLDYNPKTGIFKWIKASSKFSRNTRVDEPIIPSHHSGYIYIQIDGKRYGGHRLAWMYMHGKMPDLEIDHKNHNTSDNRIKNLRIATRLENTKNLTRRKDNASGVNGVSWHKGCGKWIARISEKGKNVNLGTFSNKEDAITARTKADKKYLYHENHGKRSKL